MIYLDNSATTKPCEASVTAATESMRSCWGNPSSLYGLGLDAENLINDTRLKIAEMINCRQEEVFFVGSGTEGNNLCIQASASLMKRRGNKIITTSIEHPSVLNTVHYLESIGFEVVKIKPTANGHINADDVINAVDDKTILVTMMLVNNETGCIFPIKEVAERVKKINPNTIIHTDCVQAFGKTDIDVEDLGVDLLTASGHKIHGPKGIGFIYKKKGLQLKPIIFGGGQEKGLRSGTESVPLIAALGGALSELNIEKSLATVTELHTYAFNKLSSLDGVQINSPLDNHLPYIINISVKSLRSETLLHFLEAREIYVSSGSACSKGKGSHVLNEMGLNSDRTDSALRISFSRDNTAADIDALCDALTLAQKLLRRKGH